MGGRESDWEDDAKGSALREAVSHWREGPEAWFENSFSRLPETVRVSPLSGDEAWVESWLEGTGATRIPWFSGPGSAWEMPFERGMAEGEVRVLLNALHETGRVTRQEASSMLPVLALGPRPGEVVLDLCASPGSKTTQICEHLGDSGVVIANEVIRGRVNTLVSNVQRHASRSSIVVNHDGRHIPKVPASGFDRVLVDVPCTGSGTTRKNPDVWSKWSPSSGRSLHGLQHDLLRRAIAVTKPGGRIVYSTCSLDPVENEAVVARALSEGIVRVIPAEELLPSVPGSPGMQTWPSLDDSGSPGDGEMPEVLLPPKVRSQASQLGQCMRVWNDSIEGSGFFIAVLEKIDPSGDESPNFEAEVERFPKEDHEAYPRPIDDDWSRKLEIEWGSVPTSMWTRGKSLLWSTEEARSVWNSERTRKGGRILVTGGRWRPLRVIHLGLIAARVRNGSLERVVSRAARRLFGHISEPFVKVERGVLESILLGSEPPTEELGGLLEGVRGSRILVDGSGSCLPVWVGARVTPMISEAEKTVMRSLLGLPIAPEEE